MMKSIEDYCCLLLMAEEKSFLMAEEKRIRGKHKFIKCFCNSSKTINTKVIINRDYNVLYSAHKQ